MSELTLHMAQSSDLFTLHVKWQDRNNVEHETRLDICVQDCNRQSELNVLINGTKTAIIN